jgi:hypothetical protein
LSPSGIASNNGTKANPALSADLFGDWREEVIWRNTSNTELRIYTTTIPANNRLYTLMHDPKYRLDIAWQNIAYNQPPHPGFFLGAGMAAPPLPNIYTVQYFAPLAGDFNRDGMVDAADYVFWRKNYDSSPGYETWRANFGFGEEPGNSSAIASPALSADGVNEPLAVKAHDRLVVASSLSFDSRVSQVRTRVNAPSLPPPSFTSRARDLVLATYRPQPFETLVMKEPLQRAIFELATDLDTSSESLDAAFHARSKPFAAPRNDLPELTAAP